MAYENISGLNILLEYGYVQTGKCSLGEDGLYQIRLVMMENGEVRDETQMVFRPDELKGVEMVFNANRRELSLE